MGSGSISNYTDILPTHHPAEAVCHARPKGAPVAGRAQYPVKHGQRSEVGVLAKCKEGQSNSPAEVAVDWTT